MNGLSIEQLNRASEILGNIAVAWFTAGVISPLFTKPEELLEVITPMVVGLTMTLSFANFSLQLVKGTKL